eukprot:gene12311-2246_t
MWSARLVRYLHAPPLILRIPCTCWIVTKVSEARTEDINRAVASAKAAFDAGRWCGMQARDRGRILARAAELLRQRIPENAFIDSCLTGRVLKEMNAQMGRIPEWFEYHAALAQSIEGSVPPFSDPDHLCYVRRVPLGVCALITPFNHPLLLASKKISVALAAGNSVVIKPPSLAPVSILELARTLTEAGVPPGVINVVPGYGGSAGKTLMEHPDVVKLDLTGGTDTGRAVGACAGHHLKHYTAELGGNAPVIVFDDCEVQQAVNGAAFAGFVASGQTCVSGKRILVQKTVFDDFVARFVDKVNGIKLGLPQDANTQMGPVVSKSAMDTVLSQIQQGVAEGATVLAGGKQPGPERCPLPGYYIEPTILGGIQASMSCFQEEIFGPVVTVTPFIDEAEAVALANNSRYGLGGSVWTRDVARAHRMARNVRCGVFWVNSHHRNDPSAPWGGYKDSGIGRENGWECFREYTETQTVVVRMS